MRYLADSNRCRWCCRPLPNHSAKVPFGFANIVIFPDFDASSEKLKLQTLYQKLQLRFCIDYCSNTTGTEQDVRGF